MRGGIISRETYIKIFLTNFASRVLNWKQGNEKKDATNSVGCSFVRHSQRKTSTHAQAERGVWAR